MRIKENLLEGSFTSHVLAHYTWNLEFTYNPSTLVVKLYIDWSYFPYNLLQTMKNFYSRILTVVNQQQGANPKDFICHQNKILTSVKSNEKLTRNTYEKPLGLAGQLAYVYLYTLAVSPSLGGSRQHKRNNKNNRGFTPFFQQ